MNRVIASLKKIRLGQVVTAFLAGVLLLVSTACSSGKVQAGTPVNGVRQEVPAGLEAVPGKKNPRPEVPDQAETNTFKRGTMNEFSDVDPRTNMSPTTEKAKALIDNAERNVIDQTSDVGENTKRILDKKGENADDFGKNLRQSAEDTKYKAQGAAKDVTRDAKDVAKDAKNATQDTTKGMTRSVNRTAEDAKQTIKANTPDADDLTRGARRAGENVKENTKAAGRDVADKTQRAVENTADKAQEAAENTSGSFQDKLNQVLKGTQRTFYKAGDAAGEAAND